MSAKKAKRTVSKSQSPATTAQAKAKRVAKGTPSPEAVLDTKNVKTTVKQVVKSTREIKYKYPETVEAQLDRKAWRQKVRAEDKKYQIRLAKLEKANDPGLSKVQAKYKAFRKEHYMVA